MVCPEHVHSARLGAYSRLIQSVRECDVDGINLIVNVLPLFVFSAACHHGIALFVHSALSLILPSPSLLTCRSVWRLWCGSSAQTVRFSRIAARSAE
jgi:hypothetical protein